MSEVAPTPRLAHAMSEISALFGAFGDRDYVGEAITQLEHALQAAKVRPLTCKGTSCSVTEGSKHLFLVGG